LNAREIDRFVEVVKALEPTFGGIHLEDIAAPRCFEIEDRLSQELKIPVFHDDQHGTAIVAAAALLNALRLVGKALGSVRVVINGAGAAGIATARLLVDLGARDVILCDTRGAIYPGRPYGMNRFKEAVAQVTNPNRLSGELVDVIRGADVFIGVSVAGAVSEAMVRSMAHDPVIMAMANPDPEIFPNEAKRAGARVVCTGRSDFPNQINNVLAFPGVLRGALEVRATKITEGMKRAAVQAIAGLVDAADLKPDFIIPTVWDERVVPSVAAAVAGAAAADGVARRPLPPAEVAKRARERLGAEGLNSPALPGAVENPPAG
ncbi:MAG TPA: malic enzyme-like NAD(P)-binding protein, partial [Bacillota bacterium]